MIHNCVLTDRSIFEWSSANDVIETDAMLTTILIASMNDWRIKTFIIIKKYFCLLFCYFQIGYVYLPSTGNSTFIFF